MTNLQKITSIQKERLAHIEFKAWFLGQAGRKDLIQRYGIGEAAATRDFAKYIDLAPKNLIYSPRRREYVPSDDFNPIFNYSPSRVASTLAEGFGDGLEDNERIELACETPTQLNRPNLQILAVVSRAIANNRAIRIRYRSLSSGETEREIVPFALVDNGLRWHVRAFDRRRKRFTDFVLTRIVEPTLLEEPPLETEQIQHDIQWNTFVTIDLIPHPSLQHKETIEADYNMQNGVLTVQLRGAVAGYVLRRWNVDCSPNHSLTGNEYHLALKNRDALDNSVDTMILAPGFNH